MKVNSKLLRAHMAYRNDTIADLAEALGITRQCLYNKLACRSQFKQTEIYIICGRYNLKTDDLIAIFFGGAA